MPPRPARYQVIGNRSILCCMLLGALTLSILAALPATAQPPTSFADDNDILEAVEMELISDDLISPNTIDVEVIEGVVRLSGTHFTLAAQRRTVSRLSTLRGVRAIADDTQIAPSGRTDQQILDHVHEALRANPVADAAQIEVTVESGIVSLSGTVDSYSESSHAELAVADVYGVRGVDNQITVDPQDSRPDSEIEPEISRRFELDPYLNRAAIDVSVKDGVVTLAGTVGSVHEQQSAEMQSWVAGVRRVDATDLNIDWQPDRQPQREPSSTVLNDLDILNMVNDALLYAPQVRAGKITADVQLAAVSLRGTVPSLAAKREAQEIVENTLGVRRVINRLKVRVPDWPGDVMASKEARQSLARDAVLSDFDLHASSHFGKVYLRGQVNTHTEKERAGEVVANVPSVLEVINQIEVEQTWQTKSDDEITEDLKRRLAWNAMINVDDVQIVVDAGVVTFFGTVSRWKERAEFEQQAYRAGARAVKNRIDVRSDHGVALGLRATLIAARAEYEFDDRFADPQLVRYQETSPQFRDPSTLPPAPNVDLILRLHNTEDEAVFVRLGHDKSTMELTLTGDGALHTPLRRSVVADFRPGTVYEVQPDQNLEIPIRSLQYGFRGKSDRWYWTKP